MKKHSKAMPSDLEGLAKLDFGPDTHVERDDENGELLVTYHVSSASPVTIKLRRSRDGSIETTFPKGFTPESIAKSMGGRVDYVDKDLAIASVPYSFFRTEFESELSDAFEPIKAHIKSGEITPDAAKSVFKLIEVVISMTRDMREIGAKHTHGIAKAIVDIGKMPRRKGGKNNAAKTAPAKAAVREAWSKAEKRGRGTKTAFITAQAAKHVVSPRTIESWLK